MIFGPTPLSEAVGAILAHGTKHEGGMFKKGRVLSAGDVAALLAAGHVSVIAARLSPEDVPEDEAARSVAIAIAGTGTTAQQAFTGRANIHGAAHGLLVADTDRLRAVNHLHESLTVATLPSYSVVAPKQMLATVKIIPFATPRAVLGKALDIIGTRPLFHVHSFQKKNIGLIITVLPQTKVSLIAKSENSIRERLRHLGLDLTAVVRVPHVQKDIAATIERLRSEGSDCILVFGASAIVDRGDVIPAGLVDAGGTVIHLGMPVDPGNLLMLGGLGQIPVLGVPSCARSPKRNGFDWVLERILAGIHVTAEDIMDMGAGGLLAEIPTRPSPRELASPAAPRVAAVVLAAGLSSRMGANKLLLDFRGEPLICATLEQLRQSAVDDIVVVTGHEAEKVEKAIAGPGLRIVRNADYAQGLATSLRAGVSAARDADAVIVCLADMPGVDHGTIDRLIAAYNPTENRSIIVPTHNGQFGNPVLWGAEHFERLAALAGDRGARSLIDEVKSEAVEIEVASDAVLRDIDTPEALAEMMSALKE